MRDGEPTEFVKIGIIDDHKFLRQSLAKLLGTRYRVSLEADNGLDLIKKINTVSEEDFPILFIVDINMPLMDGFETTKWLKANYPGSKILILSMYDSESIVLRIIKLGADGYLLKNASIEDIADAIDAILLRGNFYSEWVAEKLAGAIKSDKAKEIEKNESSIVNLTEREIEFLELACTELTYKEIAQRMFISERTTDSYRNNLFEKLNVKTRVGLVLFAMKNKIVQEK